jgi:response regulator RpfG family c-di-GMP phosphodiesterase
MTRQPNLPRVLCVDDEARVLEGLVLHLRRDFDVHTALSGDKALQKLKEIHGAAVIVSDMRMPGMDGAQLLQQVMKTYPETTRILLTGEPGRDAAIAAVNQAQIFRFLTKPCPPDQLKAAIDAGVMQYKLVNAEREILQETVLGCIQALVDVLAITNPVAFGRANRVKRLAMEFAGKLEIPAFWQLEAAAMLSQIGYVSLPVELCEKLYYGQKLTSEESTLAEGVPKIAISLLEHIPRLEPVIQILMALQWREEAIVKLGDGTIGLGTRILAMVLAYDTLIAQGTGIAPAVQTLRGQVGRYGHDLVEKFAAHVGTGSGKSEVRALPLREVQVGMVMMQEVRTGEGTLLAQRGLEINTAFLERMRSFGPGLLAEQVKVLIPAPKPVA